jgi:uncharacterized membrane protein
MKFIAVYIVSLLVFVGVDFVWLGKMGDSFYRPAMGGLAMDGFRLAPAALFYPLYAFGIVHFAVLPALAAQDWKTAGVNGLLLGLVGYGVYDLTNAATLKTWPLSLTVVDMTWGTLLTGLAALAAYGVGRFL